MPGKRRIAILGGGVGSLTSAFELTNFDGWQEKYDITVYQMGWRLGGKGASGRNPEIANRIEEHGIHFWMGFYENAFHVIRQAYGECAAKGLSPGSPFATWQDAFQQQHIATNMEMTPNGWRPWPIHFPANDSLPGDPQLFDGEHPAGGPWDLALLMTRFVVREFESVSHHFSPFPADLPFHLKLVLDELKVDIEQSVFHLLHGLFQLLEPAMAIFDLAAKALVFLLDHALEAIERAYPNEIAEDARRFLYLADSGLAMVRGMIVDDVLTRGFDAIDYVDLMEWLVSHGCTKPRNPFILAGYDALFAYKNGNPETPNISAGVAVHGFLRMFLTYRGSVFWKMNAGMGDTIFSPLYLVLKARGVKFEFFQRVTHLGLNEQKTAIASIQIDVQATLRDPAVGYDPLVTVNGLPCWPSYPKYEQLNEADELRKFNLESDYTPWHGRIGTRTLRAGADFDDAVLGIPIAALRYICPELIAANSAWHSSIDHVATVQTQAMQLWLRKDYQALGYPPQPADQPPCVTAFVEPHDTWAEMTQLLDREQWRPEDEVKQIAYFCNAFPDAPSIPAPFTDPDFPARELARVREAAITFLNRDLPQMWTGLQNGFDWDLLVDRTNQQGEKRLDSQYLRANIDGTERYTLSVKGSTRFRLHPGKSGFSNLYLAGDWTENVINAGCVEAAAISGRLASQAICGKPEHIYMAFAIEDPTD